MGSLLFFLGRKNIVYPLWQSSFVKVSGNQINKWNSMENAQKFAHSPELKAAMEKAGVVGAPNIHFLNEA
jgi:hypothetical protein